jgi:hypothetical protein
MTDQKMPRDPDMDHVPPELEQLDGERVTITGVDRETGELVQLPGTLAVVPGLHGDAERHR